MYQKIGYAIACEIQITMQRLHVPEDSRWVQPPGRCTNRYC